MDRHAAHVRHGAGIGVLGDARDSHRHDLTTKLPQSDCLVLGRGFSGIRSRFSGSKTRAPHYV